MPDSGFQEVYNELFVEEFKEDHEASGSIFDHEKRLETEYKSHVLWPMLNSFSLELKDFVEEGRRLRQKLMMQ